MKQERLILAIIIGSILLIAGVSIIGGKYLSEKTDPQPPIIDKPLDPITGPIDFDSTPFTFEDRFQIDLIDGWELISENQDQRVDRYRFERPDDTTSVLTLSFYDAGDITTFEQLVERRYGGAVLDFEEDLTIDNKQAKRVVASFLGNGSGVRTGADVMIQIEEDFYISINGLHYRDGEDALTMLSQIDYMQTSFKEIE